MTIRFIANNSLVETESYGLRPALDFIRGELGLTGTKEGCREGDCGACSVLVGKRRARPEGGFEIDYRAQASCVMSLAELDGRHLVTIEGLAASGRGKAGSAVSGGAAELTPVMRAILDENGSQCGFCTPGFVVALTAFLLQGPPFTEERALSSIESNLCRCTGYGAQKRAALRLARDFAGLSADPTERIRSLVEASVVPSSLLGFALGELLFDRPPESAAARPARTKLLLGGGTDFLVRHPHPEGEECAEGFALLSRDLPLGRVSLVGGGGPEDLGASVRAAERGPVGPRLEVGAALSWREFFSDKLVRELVPSIALFEVLLASPLVRERATLGGNVGNASPVADMSSILIALGARSRLRDETGGERELPLEDIFLGYKKLDLHAGEFIASFAIPADRQIILFNFEKASKREKLDIAAVNTAASFFLEEGSGTPRIASARISAGGVAATPLLLKKTSAYLAGREPNAQTAAEAARIAAAEVSPIGDVRGSAEYRSRILYRFVIGHFVRLFPGCGAEEALP